MAKKVTTLEEVVVSDETNTEEVLTVEITPLDLMETEFNAINNMFFDALDRLRLLADHKDESKAVVAVAGGNMSKAKKAVDSIVDMIK